MKMWKSVMSAAAAVAFVGSSAMGAHLDNPNQVVDPSFEDPGLFTMDGAPFVGSWEAFSSGADAPAAESGQMPRTGAQSLDLMINGVANQFAGAFQDVQFSPALAGQMAWWSGWHKLIGDTGGSEIRIEWRDSVNDVEISRTQITDGPSVQDTYEEFILADVIPAGADTARVVYAIQSFGGALNQQVYVDDVNFNYVPEPASAALLGLGGLAMLRRRK